MFSAAIDGAVYAKHGTNTETRLTVIDRMPADDILARQTGQAVNEPARLVAPMLMRFMATDRAFAKARRSRQPLPPEKG